MSTLHPQDAPPTYEAATASSSTPTRVSTDEGRTPTERNSIPFERRRSMEDENRPLPPGWIRQFDPQEQHQFFVDTTADPPRSTWVHPYDDPDFLATLPPEERKKHSRLHRSVTLEDLAAEDTDDEGHHVPKSQRKSTTAGVSSSAALPPRSSSPEPTGIHKFGRSLKDKLTGTNHEQRERQRREREEEERAAYQAHLRLRTAMVRAIETGEPQFLGKDRNGKDVYIEPPGMRGGYGGYASGGYGFNPYMPRGPYANPNMRYMRPAGPYYRPYGPGYGGGLGAPVAAGLLGGALLGGLMF